jgi:putative NADH-flavin reductase
MKIALIGATGFVGSHILKEALDRGHQVTALVRHPEEVPAHGLVRAKKVDVYSVDELASLLSGHEAVISAFSADKGTPDMYQRMVDGAENIIAATKKAAVTRLLVVGGAGTLEVAPGRRILDEPDFPEEWRAGASGTAEFLSRLKEEPDLDWTFLSPAKVIQPGERTGKFRLGEDQLVTDDEGNSVISLQDYAVAMIDELEQPKHTRKRFTLAY